MSRQWLLFPGRSYSILLSVCSREEEKNCKRGSQEANKWLGDNKAFGADRILCTVCCVIIGVCCLRTQSFRNAGTTSVELSCYLIVTPARILKRHKGPWHAWGLVLIVPNFEV